MMFNMPTLPYAHNALEPVISQATIDFHYGKHLQTYVNNLNNLVPGTAFEGKTLEEIVATAPDGPVFNNAGQVLNHTFYFLQFAPSPARHEPEGPLADAIRRDFGSFDNFKKEFTAAATSLFGSGWAWLSADKDGKLHITKEAQQSTPCGPHAPAHLRRMGACLLSGLSEPSCRPSTSTVEYHRLADSRRTI